MEMVSTHSIKSAAFMLVPVGANALEPSKMERGAKTVTLTAKHFNNMLEFKKFCMTYVWNWHGILMHRTLS